MPSVIPNITWELLSTKPSYLTERIGILPDILNTVYIVLATLVIVLPLGVGAAIYLTEYAKNKKLVAMIEYAAETLSGIPSIIYGLVGMLLFSNNFGTSLLAGALTLVIMNLPTVMRTTQVELYLNGESCVMKGIRRYLYEIIYNLCDNAIRYNKDGGKVAIDLKNAGDNIILSVSDTGIGIPAEHQSRIFERFYRVDKSHSKKTGGTGLGLSIVKHAVAYHGGKVTLSSEVGKGTTITVEF